MSNNESREQLVCISTTIVDALISVAHTDFASAESLVALNFETIREALDDGAENARTLLSCRTPQEAVSLQSALGKTAADQAVAYSRSVLEIAGAAANELGSLFQSQCEELNKAAREVGENAAKSSPFGSELVQAAVKQATQLSDSYLTAVSTVLKSAAGAREKR